MASFDSASFSTNAFGVLAFDIGTFVPVVPYVPVFPGWYMSVVPPNVPHAPTPSKPVQRGPAYRWQDEEIIKL